MSQEQSVVLAVPSVSPGGLDAACNVHFGRCECFTLVEIADGKVGGVSVVENPPHTDCLGPVVLLAGNGAEAVAVGGIGARPLMGFQQAGINVYIGQAATVSEMVENFQTGKLAPADASNVCRGHGSH